MILIGLTGRASAGKSTVAKYLCEQHGFDELAFATPIKQALALILREFGTTLEDFEDPARKVTPIDDITRTPRELLQTLGTEWGRERVCEGLWVRILARRLARLDYAPAMVISDVRFANEAQWIRDIGGQVWGIVRPRASKVPATHQSEIGLVPELVDKWILNDTDVAALRARVDFLLEGKTA